MRRPTPTSIARGFAPFFSANGWTWTTRGKRTVPPYVPNENQIRKTVVQMVGLLRGNDSTVAIEAGRIRVSKRYDERGHVNGFDVELIAKSGALWL